MTYRGRLAPSPTGYLHLGHARTFWIAWRRARAAGGQLVFRNEDLDWQRSRPEFVNAMYEDLRWLGLDWDEGPDLSLPMERGLGLSSQRERSGQPGASGGPYAPYAQSQRRDFYLAAWRRLRDSGLIYPCTCSRKDLERALSAPHEENGPAAQASLPVKKSSPQPRAAALQNTDSSPPPKAALRNMDSSPQPRAAALQNTDSSLPPRVPAQMSAPDDELPYPGTCRAKIATARDYDAPAGMSWRLRVPEGEAISFEDGHFGRQEFVAGRDFADFLLWRRDDVPAYQLAVVVDDGAMRITEVVRGADLLKSTARQLLLFRALSHPVPAYFHCPLLRDENNLRLAKRHDALSLRQLREQGVKPEALRESFEQAMPDVLFNNPVQSSR